MDLWTYSPEEVTILVMGVPLEGVVEGTFVSLTRQAPIFTSSSTADGRITRTYNAADIWDIQFTLMNTSPSNGFLDKLVLLDRVTKRGKFPLMIKDGFGGTLIFSTTTWIEELPSITYGVEMTERVWTLKSANAVVNINGNESPSSMAEDILGTVASALPGIL